MESTAPPHRLCVFSIEMRPVGGYPGPGVRIASATSSRSSVPSAAVRTVRGDTPPTAAGAALSYQRMCDASPRISSSPRLHCARTAERLPIVPLATKTPASLPSNRADFSSSALTVGSSPYWSSPTSAFIIASRISGVGRVTVSDRRSITLFMSLVTCLVLRSES